jgi:Putative prokaryotic signal transducing protein
MEIDIRALAESYAQMSEQELLELGQDYDSLTPQAQEVLRSEFARRKMEPPTIEPSEGPTPEEGRELITIRRYRQTAEAIVAQSLLHSAGIETFVRDESLFTTGLRMTDVLGGIRLQVRAADGPAAEEILTQPLPDSTAFFDEPLKDES